MTNHDLAHQLLDLARRDGGLQMGQDFMSLTAVEAMYDAFVEHVPVREVYPGSHMTILGVVPYQISVGYRANVEQHRSWCEMSDPNPPKGFQHRICNCRSFRPGENPV